MQYSKYELHFEASFFLIIGIIKFERYETQKSHFIFIHLIENIVSFISDGCCKGLNYNIFHQLNADEHSKFFYNESQILFNLSNMQTKYAGMENFS